MFSTHIKYKEYYICTYIVIGYSEEHGNSDNYYIGIENKVEKQRGEGAKKIIIKLFFIFRPAQSLPF